MRLLHRNKGVITQDWGASVPIKKISTGKNSLIYLKSVKEWMYDPYYKESLESVLQQSNVLGSNYIARKGYI